MCRSVHLKSLQIIRLVQGIFFVDQSAMCRSPGICHRELAVMCRLVQEKILVNQTVIRRLVDQFKKWISQISQSCRFVHLGSERSVGVGENQILVDQSVIYRLVDQFKDFFSQISQQCADLFTWGLPPSACCDAQISSRKDSRRLVSDLQIVEQFKEILSYFIFRFVHLGSATESLLPSYPHTPSLQPWTHLHSCVCVCVCVCVWCVCV